MTNREKELAVIALGAVFTLDGWEEHSSKYPELTEKVRGYVEYEAAKHLKGAMSRPWPSIFNKAGTPPEKPSNQEVQSYLDQFAAIWQGKNGAVPDEVVEVRLAVKAIERFFGI